MIAANAPEPGPVVIVCADADGIAARALDLCVDRLGAAIRQVGEGHLALTGGSSAAALFRRLREGQRGGALDWSRVHVWQGDERFVPLDHPDSNWAVAQRDWLSDTVAGAIPEEQLHPMPVGEAITAGHDATWAAARYAAELERCLPRRHGRPAMDAWLLGVGGDGHILSAFPAGEWLQDDGRLALGVPAPTHITPHVARVTLAPRLLMAAGLLVVMAPGAAKSAVIADCFRADREPARLPAQLALRPNAVWLLDRDSAADLRTRQGR